jgi:hypothetical protein
MPWKSQPIIGYAMGIARDADDKLLDGATVTIESVGNGETRTVKTDGGGFFGALNLAPGAYRAVATSLDNKSLYSSEFEVNAGEVAKVDLSEDITAPVTTIALDPATPTGANGWYVNDVNVSLTATDNLSGVALTEYSIDGGATWQIYTNSLTINNEGTNTILYRSIDRAGNIAQAETLTVKLDKTAPNANLAVTPAIIWAPTGRTETVIITGNATDAVSGLKTVSYVVTDEYGTSLSIPTRTLTQNSDSWTDTLKVKAHRRGNDRDGRLYRIVATVTDAAGNTTSIAKNIVVLYKRRR